jgi:hypothetical protein
MAMSMKMAVFGVLRLVVWQILTDISEMLTALIVIRTIAYSPDDGSNKHL